MNNRFLTGISVLIVCQTIFAAKPTMQYLSQPASTVYTMPAAFSVYNLAPVPQNLCSPTLSTGIEKATCSGLPVCHGETLKTASFSCSVTTNCASTVPANRAGGTCSLSLTVTKPANLPANTSFSFSLSYGSYNALLISNGFTINGTNPSPPASSYRTITFKNSCNNPIWFGSVSGAAPTSTVLTGDGIDCSGGSGDAGKQACVSAGGACYARIANTDACLSQACTSDANCVTGASCNSQNNKCFWNNPTPTNPSYMLNQGETNTVKIPEYPSNGIGVVWSGAFGGRTGCTSGGCVSGLCTSGSENAEGACSLGTGFQQPATQAEPTFITYPTGLPTINTPTDSYDVTLINGANVPMSMYPTNTALPSSGNPYTCGAPGYNQSIPNSQPIGGTIGASYWQLSNNQSNLAYRYVVTSETVPTRCSSDNDCASGFYCGLNYSSDSIGSTASSGKGYLVCGLFAGWFTPDQICGTNNYFTTALNSAGIPVKDFQCTTSVNLGSMSNLYQCNGNYAVSCYSSTSSNCCGCADWSTHGIVVPSNPTYVQPCLGHNDQWTGLFDSVNQPQVYDTIYYLKQSCPSCYVYPFDDKSSSFTCTNGTSITSNTEDYTVEFCPGGNGNTGFQPPAH